MAATSKEPKALVPAPRRYDVKTGWKWLRISHKNRVDDIDLRLANPDLPSSHCILPADPDYHT